ncbi:MAG TPA: hypothetical protein DIS66_00815 [Candidatus Omnitrophica bacterium]|nr:hypothetical protein [Candidatus Omnitrophota bacterium]
MKFSWKRSQGFKKPETGVEQSRVSQFGGGVLRLLMLLFVLAAVAAIALHYLKTNREASKFYNELNQKAKPMVASVASKIPKPVQVAPEGPRVKLILKSGRSFEGIFVRKNREGQWLYMDGVGEVFFSVSEIAETA